MRQFAELQVETWTVRAACRAAMVLAFAVVLAFLGPFGTDAYGGFQRIGYWTICMAAWPVLAGLIGHPLARRAGAPAGSLRDLGLSTLFASVPMLAVTASATMAVSDWQPSLPEMIEQLGGAWLIGGAFTYLSDRVIDAVLATPAAGSPVPDAAAPAISPPHPAAPAAEDALEDAFLDRLPVTIGRDVLCLQVEDHYLRVHTAHGSALILMRFSDALRSLSPDRGLRVHRSWWVAHKAIADVRRSGRTAELTLANGLVVPVSQPYLGDVAAAWDATSRRSA